MLQRVQRRLKGCRTWRLCDLPAIYGRLSLCAAFSSSFAVEASGHLTNGDGTGTVTGSEMRITIPPTPDGSLFPKFPPSASSATLSYSFTYTFNNDGSFTNAVTGTFHAGPRSGQTFTVSNFPQFLRMASQDSSALTLATLVPTVPLRTRTAMSGRASVIAPAS